MKICLKCGLEKERLGFSLSKATKDGLQTACKVCKNSYAKIYNKVNKEKVSVARKARHEANRDRDCAYDKAYRESHPESVKAKARRWTSENIGHVRETRNKRKRLRYATDINYRIECRLRSRVKEALFENKKAGSAVKDVGCTIDELRLHLESKFYLNPETGEPMSWENYGYKGWHIDHKLPLAAFDLNDREQFLQACHYTNLQPLWAKDNYSKRDRLDWT